MKLHSRLERYLSGIEMALGGLRGAYVESSGKGSDPFLNDVTK